MMHPLLKETESKYRAVQSQHADEKLILCLTSIGQFQLQKNGGPTSARAWDFVDAERDVIWGTMRDLSQPFIHYMEEFHGKELWLGCSWCKRPVSLSALKKTWQIDVMHLEIQFYRDSEPTSYHLYQVHCSSRCCNQFREKHGSNALMEEDIPPNDVKITNGLSFVHLFDLKYQNSVSLIECNPMGSCFLFYFETLQPLLTYDPDSIETKKAILHLQKLWAENQTVLLKSEIMWKLPIPKLDYPSKQSKEMLQFILDHHATKLGFIFCANVEKKYKQYQNNPEEQQKVYDMLLSRLQDI